MRANKPQRHCQQTWSRGINDINTHDGTLIIGSDQLLRVLHGSVSHSLIDTTPSKHLHASSGRRRKQKPAYKHTQLARAASMSRSLYPHCATMPGSSQRDLSHLIERFHVRISRCNAPEWHRLSEPGVILSIACAGVAPTLGARRHSQHCRRPAAVQTRATA